MNPSNTNSTYQSVSSSVANSSLSIDVPGREPALNEEESYCTYLGSNLYKVIERVFLLCGSFAILFFLIGFLSLQNDGHGETFVLVGAGFLIVIGTYMAGQRHRLERERSQRAHILQTHHRNYEQRRNLSDETQNPNDPVYIVALPSEHGTSQAHLDAHASIFPSLILRPNEESQERNVNPKPLNDDDPPKYEDVVASPPPYESLNPNHTPS